MSDDKQTIVFGNEVDPAKKLDYQKKIESVRVNALKGNEPLGVIPRPPIPSLARNIESPPSLSSTGGVQPRPAGSPILSPETQDRLAAMSQAQDRDAKKAEETIKKDIESNKDDLLDMFDFTGVQNEASRILNNKKRRVQIESRCSPMSFEDLLLKDEVRQVVQIRDDGRFNVTYRSITPEETLFLKQLMAKDNSPSEAYALEKYSLCELCCSLVAINDSAFVDHRKSDGSPDEDLFKTKLKQLMKKSGYIIADLGVNYSWFDIRVRKLIAPEALGNG